MRQVKRNSRYGIKHELFLFYQATMVCEKTHMDQGLFHQRLMNTARHRRSDFDPTDFGYL